MFNVFVLSCWFALDLDRWNAAIDIKLGRWIHFFCCTGANFARERLAWLGHEYFGSIPIGTVAGNAADSIESNTQTPKSENQPAIDLAMESSVASARIAQLEAPRLTVMAGWASYFEVLMLLSMLSAALPATVPVEIEPNYG